MKIKYFKKAFSLTETIIMLTILAIAVASLTPMITKKLANNVEAGTTINGVSHGRYEIYAKEIVEFGSKAYEKSGRETKRAEASVLVFDRLDDLTYKKYASKSPEMNSKGQKSTLYEQIDNAKAYRSPSGDIEYVEFKKNGATKKYPVGGNIIVESSNVIYTEGKIIPGNPDSFEKKSGGIVLPNDNNRIIEGALTKKFNKKSDDNNILWHIDAKNDNADNFEGTVTVIPWEKVISGNKIIVDKPIKKDPITGEYIGTFDPGLGTKSLVLHAVGGGGAGGGLNNIGGAVTPKNATEDELNQMKQILGNRFKEVAAAKGLPQAGLSIDSIVRVVNYPSLYKENYSKQFSGEDNYITLNQADGTITVKFDTRTGIILPNELLDYTNDIGSQTQKSDIYDMPIWGSFETIASGGDRGKPFYAGTVACGFGGGAGSSYKIDSANVHVPCKRDIYCEPMTVETGTGNHCCDYDWVTGEDGKKSYECVDNFNGYYRFCMCDCNATYYKRTTGIKRSGYCPSTPPEECPTNEECVEATATICQHEMKGGAGGAAPGCAVACTVAPHPVEVYSTCTGGQGASGVSRPKIVKIGNTVSVQPGQKGGDCFAFAGNFTAMSMGGGGGQPCGKVDHFEIAIEAGALAGKKLGEDIPPEKFAESIEKQGDLFDTFKEEYGDVKGQTNYVTEMESERLTGTALESAYDKLDSYQQTFEAKMAEPVSSEFKNYFGLPVGATIGAAFQAVVSQTQNLMYYMNAAAASGDGKSLQYNTSSGQWVGSLDFYSAMTDISKQYADFNSEMNLVMSMPPSKTYAVPNEQICLTPTCGSSTTCGAPGSPGKATNNCADTTGIDTTDNGGIYNHIYSWTAPYAFNRLTYGEAGEPGEYKTTKIAETTGKFTIILGLGGVWTDHKDTINGKWAKGVSGQAKRGLDGTDTIVKMGTRNVLTAKGGKGGTQALLTDRYELCYAKKDECKRTDASVTCCDNEIGKRSTKEIFTTASKMSAFENIKALTGNSTIIGIGLGRGGEGAGTRAGVEQLKGLRVFRNASGYNVSYGDSQIKKEEGTYKADLANLDAFKNYALAPSGLNFKGGDGAVIITW